MSNNGSTPDLPQNAISALRHGQKIEAIKILRQAWGIDLKEAKMEVEKYIDQHPEIKQSLQKSQAELGANFFRWLVIVGLTALTVFYFWPR